MRRRQIGTIARFTLLEAVRTRLPWLFGTLLLLTIGSGWFLRELAITESIRIQLGFYASAIRIIAVFVLSLHVITSMVREFQDKGLELALSFDLQRGEYLFGRLLGFLGVALLAALLAALPTLAFAPATAVLQWCVSLASELAMMAALSLFCILTFTQVIPAASFTFGFYLLARTLDAIRLMSLAPLISDTSVSHQFISWLVEGLALVIPSFDHYTQSAWLADVAPPWATLAWLVGEALLYVLLLTSAALFDFYRRNV